MTGIPKNAKQSSEDTGKPGRPMKILFSFNPSVVGLPGFIEIPWTITSEISFKINGI